MTEHATLSGDWSMNLTGFFSCKAAKLGIDDLVFYNSK